MQPLTSLHLACQEQAMSTQRLILQPVKLGLKFQLQESGILTGSEWLGENR